MKKFIKTVKDYIQEKIDKYVITRFQKLMPKELIKSLYRVIAEHDLIITTKEVNVKKGKIKYTLIITETPKGKLIFNLGRHLTKEPVPQIQ